MGRSSVEIHERAAIAVRKGHPWVYRDQIRGSPALVSGDEVTIFSGGERIGCGIWDASSPIAVRIWTKIAQLDDVLAKRLERALLRRDEMFNAEGVSMGGATTAFRCLNGEGDRAPGFVVDRYASACILRTDGEGARARLEWLVRELWPRLRARGATSLALRDEKKLEPIEGDTPASIDVLEHGMPMRVDLARGQKTGAFLDQRENRRRVFALARGRRVLNLFAYAGGFSVSAALGGAARTTSVDVSPHLHKNAQDSFRLAGIDPAAHAFVTADAFAFLAGQREKWDLVVSDPPSFAPNEAAKARAIGAYKKLHRACAAVLAPNGILCATSCSSHVTERDFLATLDDSALEREDLSVRELYGPPADHPFLPGFLEGRYLKFAVLA